MRQVAEQLINPFGDDDEDFELNWLIDRHVKVVKIHEYIMHCHAYVTSTLTVAAGIFRLCYRTASCTVMLMFTVHQTVGIFRLCYRTVSCTVMLMFTVPLTVGIFGLC